MKQKFLLSALFIFTSLLIFAQDITISGNVQDDKKQALFGATVLVKGTTIGTKTDESGNYTIKVPKDSKTLIISYIGFDAKEISIKNNQGNYVENVNLASADIGLNQVVVSASRRKEKLLDAPASVSVLGQDKLERNITTTPVEQLKTTTGVDVMRTGLVSSNIAVRGFNNIFSGSVLNVVDNRIGSVPSLRINAYQLVPTSNLDYDKIEVVRGPASALYGPNATSGVIHIMTKSPLDQEKKFETTVAMTTGFTVLDNTNKDGFGKTLKDYNGGLISGNVINPEIRHSGKLLDGKIGYKVSGSYFQGQDYPNYDAREPYDNKFNPYSTPYGGDSMIFGSARHGQVFTPDTIQKFTHVDGTGNTVLDSAHLDIRRFKKDFFIRKYTFDGRLDFKPTNDILITLNGGLAGTHNVELTGLGAAQGGGLGRGWIYWYFQARFKWKDLFVQYFINSSDAGNTYLIPQLSASARNGYSADNPYKVQLLIDKSKLHVVQVQYAYTPLEKLRFIFGVDLLVTRPNTQGTINGRFEERDNVVQVGEYIQGEYEPLNWLKLVAAVRVDYNSIIKTVAASPRAALVFKVAPTHSIRLTYNRAFDSPNTLNQFLDLSNGFIPNGINVRGIGNPYGWNYKYADNGQVQFISAPYSSGGGSWYTYGDQSHNYQLFDTMMTFIKDGFKARPGADPAQIESIFNGVFNGIQGQGGTIDSAKMIALDYANFATTKGYESSKQNVAKLFATNLKKINNSYTQTLELGYKGLIAGKLSIQLDGYWSRTDNYVSALKPASGAVMFDWKTYLGPNAPGGRLYDNLHLVSGFYDHALMSAGLNGNPALQNDSIVPSDSTTCWDELVVLMHQLPIGTITPNDPGLIGSDFILTYKNVGRLDVFGIDLGLQYDVVQTEKHLITLGGNFSWVDKDKFTLTSGEIIYLNAPKLKTAFTLDHTLKTSGFSYGLNFRYQMGYYASSSIYAGEVKPAYLLDARISWRASFYKGLMLSINANNIANYQWSSFPGTPRMGTSFYARAQVTF